MPTKVNVKKMVSQSPQLGEYTPFGFYSVASHWQHRKPRFGTYWVPYMTTDPRIQFGLRLIKGPLLANARFEIKAPAKVKEFLQKQIDRFWSSSAIKALTAVEWGYAGFEAMYRIEDNQIAFDELITIQQWDSRVLTVNGRKVGISVRHVPGRKGRVYLGGPKGFWHVQGREYSPFYGLSRLRGAYSPWFEAYTDGGAYDIRRLYYHKYAFSGDVMYYPPGFTGNESGGQQSNKDLAREIIEKRKTGGVVALPNIVDESGKRRWEIESGTVNTNPINVLEYLKDLKDEILEGMGIPPEVAAAEGTGAYAGRRVPQQAFFAMLQEMVHWLITDADRQIFAPLVALNFGKVSYEINPLPLMQEEQDGEEATPGQESAGGARGEKSDQNRVSPSVDRGRPTVDRGVPSSNGR